MRSCQELAWRHPVSDLQLLIDEIQGQRRSRVLGAQRGYRQDHPRASSIGNCAREVFYQITQWELKPTHDAELLFRFQRGSDVELIVKRELLGDGHEVVEAQRTFEIKEHVPELGKDLIICTGHIDGRIAHKGIKPVVEIKSLHPNVWARIETFEDFGRMGSFWARYPRQLLLYCYAHSEPDAMFLLDDCLGHWKLVPAFLEDHMDACERALQIAKTAAVAVETGTEPDFIDDPSECRRCWARQAGVCFPPLDHSADAVQIVNDELVGVDLARTAELREGGEEFNRLVKGIKNQFKARGAGRYLAGDFLVEVEVKSKKTFATWSKVNDG
jgi:hypothetical protein